MYFESFNISVIVYEISSKCDIWFYLPCVKTFTYKFCLKEYPCALPDVIMCALHLETYNPSLNTCPGILKLLIVTQGGIYKSCLTSGIELLSNVL